MSEPRAAYNIDLPPDLNLAIMTILSFHTSSSNPIPRLQLCSALKDFKISDRHIRDRIKQLRRSGHLIGSSSGDKCGYYLITNAEDLKEFLAREYLAKINDMRQTVEAMTKSASQRWGPDSIQPKLL
jgi:biotin operon repressor